MNFKRGRARGPRTGPCGHGRSSTDCDCCWGTHQRMSVGSRRATIDDVDDLEAWPSDREVFDELARSDARFDESYCSAGGCYDCLGFVDRAAFERWMDEPIFVTPLRVSFLEAFRVTLPQGRAA